MPAPAVLGLVDEAMAGWDPSRFRSAQLPASAGYLADLFELLEVIQALLSACACFRICRRSAWPPSCRTPAAARAARRQPAIPLRRTGRPMTLPIHSKTATARATLPRPGRSPSLAAPRPPRGLASANHGRERCAAGPSLASGRVWGACQVPPSGGPEGTRSALYTRSSSRFHDGSRGPGTGPLTPPPFRLLPHSLDGPRARLGRGVGTHGWPTSSTAAFELGGVVFVLVYALRNASARVCGWNGGLVEGSRTV